MKITIGSRGSKLALWQAQYTLDMLRAAGHDAEIRIIKTIGDQVQHLGFDKMEGKGFFTKEIEEALLAGEIDLAVHSCKDLPTASHEDLEIAAYSSREMADDVLLIRPDRADQAEFLQLPRNAVAGTSSSRRKAQLLSFRPDIQLKDIRGNVPTRIRKLRDGEFDAILLAAAGLIRLQNELAAELDGIVKVNLSPTMFIPAPAQGVLAYQIRKADGRMREVVKVLNDEAACETAISERQILSAFEGGCQVPIGIYSIIQGSARHTWISKAAAWNSMPRRMHINSMEDVPVEDVLKSFQREPRGSVFISTFLEAGDIFRRHLEAMHVEVAALPLVEFAAKNFQVNLSGIDWLFFSSKNAVRFFFQRSPDLPGNVRLAAINQGTAAALAQMGKPVSFAGEGGNMEEIALEFDRTDGSRVLFPRAEHSKQTIQKLLALKMVEEVVVYDNFPIEKVERRSESILVFTSPMNADNYFSRYDLSIDQQAVAIGQSTAEAINRHGWECVVAFEPSKWALVDEVTRLLCNSGPE